jgi:hypothetical protein
MRLLCLARLPYCPDEQLHFRLWQAVCCGFTGAAGGASPPWQLLGCSAANPAADFGSTGLLCPLLLLLLLEQAPTAARQLLTAAQGSPAQGVPAFRLTEAAVLATQRLQLHLVRGSLQAEAQQQGSYIRAAGEWGDAAVSFEPPSSHRQVALNPHAPAA